MVPRLSGRRMRDYPNPWPAAINERGRTAITDNGVITNIGKVGIGIQRAAFFKGYGYDPEPAAGFAE